MENSYTAVRLYVVNEAAGQITGQQTHGLRLQRCPDAPQW